ncbi:MAG: valine--tRNA ligase [bacterium]
MSKELAKIYNPCEVEDKIYKKWEESGYFNPDKSIEEGIINKDAKSFSIVMPPPNATGTLHLGHAAMLALEDILIRYNRMKGNKTLWIPGTDHAAIATQTKVEKILKEEGINRHEIGRIKFLKRVEEFVENSRNTIKNQTKKMGSSCDWSREAFTLDDIRNKAVRAVFKMMYDDGLIYRGERIINWCPRCHSTLADDEVEYKAQKSKLYTFKYNKDFPFAVATTRPETKLGDTAVAVNPKDERYKKYIGKIFNVDFCGVKLKLKIIADRNVDMNFGAGALGVTPAHSMVDWDMAKENELEIIKVINEDGNIREYFGEFSGKSVAEARKMIAEKLLKNNLIEKEEDINNNLSVCYRCGMPVEPLPSLQWFINVNKKIPRFGKSIKELSVEAVRTGVFGREKIKIVPERFKKNYFNWMESLHDWCISRQIWYGHQIPVWYRAKKTTNQEYSKIKNGDQEIYVGVESPKGDNWIQDEDTLDTWFSAGLWTFSTMAHKKEQIRLEGGKLIINSEDFKNFHPTSVLETGYDIIFFWVARMIIMTTYAVENIPFQDVYLHGLVRDEHGKKMSKSLGNVIDPLDMIKKFGTDAVRLSLTVGTSPGNDMNLSEEKVAGFRNFTNKLWNIARYALGSIEEGKDAGKEIGNLTLADKWILDKLDNIIKLVTDDIENYRFSQAGETLREFTWNDFADWYLEIAKVEGGKGGILEFVLKNLLKLWHPFMPFVTEKIWEEMENKNMLIIEKWPSQQNKKTIKQQNNKAENDFNLIRNIIFAVRNGRSQYKISLSRKIKAIIYAGDKKELVESHAELIKKLRTGLEYVEVKESGEKIKNAIYIAVNGIDVYLVIPDVDFGAEISRLEKEIKEQERRIFGQNKKLENKDFIERAPKEIIDGEREKLELWEDVLMKMREQLNHLK